MSGAISLTAINRMAFGKTAAARRLIAVLGAAFDDSGTDTESPICVIACVVGTEDQWEELANLWSAQLKNPLPGKSELNQFHLSDCMHHSNEFENYNIAECDHIQYLFRQIILRTKFLTIAVAVDKIAWNELVTSDLFDELGEPIDLCFVRCMERLIFNARRYRPGEPISCFYDKGTEKKLHQWVRLFESQKAQYPELDHHGFAPVAKVYPLQAADVVATGTFHYDKEWVKNRANAVPSPHFRDFINNPYSEGITFGRDQIASKPPCGSCHAAP